ncbi:MAG: aspartate-semialdehyde dehydrogenase [Candidatus Aenigmarchaeota archaeon ex4484_52]|nr:MAG: aspartate-semialdehyde dehydrogenase [Candidatus Aenigmarchaeota archaeon ex4484_52]
MKTDKIKIGILGATGMVGQRFISFLQNHPYFEIKMLAASKHSAGYKYKDVCNWALETPMPLDVKDQIIINTEIDEIIKKDVKIVFSALPGNLAGDIENKCAEDGIIVCSNASAHRMDKDVPLVIGEVNPEHLQLIQTQKKNKNRKGAIITNPNCSVIQLALSLKPLDDAYGVEKIIVSTMQALSGAGRGGVAAFDILDNVIPYIDGEEEKIEEESKKILGVFDKDKIINHKILVSASANRINVLDGHTECVFCQLKKQPKNIDEVKNIFKNYKSMPQELNLPSAPKNPIIVIDDGFRPQPRYDRMKENGMAISIGRIRQDNCLGGIKYVCVGHNAIRGAVGASVLNAELFVKKYFDF